ncbi:protein EcsC [Loktanella sp. D2R18]|uniref:EcsC family protein n=1 Tax=Rhodobacterales TaxID=204455 RepID=UPI000DEB51DB|nr:MULTISPECIES: EcsC family protein [Rhodobacterales]MDO6590135.1 EcsC family protein [Yoonia sp. 1_MG-2023]RBW45751.1 protein EcsC [Loktanella sp. D2R18]
MTTSDDPLLAPLPAEPLLPLDAAASAEVQALARKQKRARGVLMTAITFVGGQVEDGLKLLPKPVRGQVDDIARKALERSFDLAAKSRGGLGKSIGSDRAHKALGTVSGALGGVGGLPTALVELPIATTVIFRAVLHVAEDYGEDPHSVETRMACLAVFGAGGPGAEDDGVDTAFIGARLGLSGAAVHGLISKVAPKFAAVMTQKLATQTVPILGAAAGAGTNYAFVDYYVALAHVHFGLRKLARDHGEAEVTEAFHAALADQT